MKLRNLVDVCCLGDLSQPLVSPYCTFNSAKALKKHLIERQFFLKFVVSKDNYSARLKKRLIVSGLVR